MFYLSLHLSQKKEAVIVLKFYFVCVTCVNIPNLMWGPDPSFENHWCNPPYVLTNPVSHHSPFFFSHTLILFNTL